MYVNDKYYIISRNGNNKLADEYSVDKQKAV